MTSQVGATPNGADECEQLFCLSFFLSLQLAAEPRPFAPALGLRAATCKLNEVTRDNMAEHRRWN